MGIEKNVNKKFNNNLSRRPGNTLLNKNKKINKKNKTKQKKKKKRFIRGFCQILKKVFRKITWQHLNSISE